MGPKPEKDTGVSGLISNFTAQLPSRRGMLKENTARRKWTYLSSTPPLLEGVKSILSLSLSGVDVFLCFGVNG